MVEDHPENSDQGGTSELSDLRPVSPGKDIRGVQPLDEFDLRPVRPGPDLKSLGVEDLKGLPLDSDSDRSDSDTK